MGEFRNSPKVTKPQVLMLTSQPRPLTLGPSGILTPCSTRQRLGVVRPRGPFIAAGTDSASPPTEEGQVLWAPLGRRPAAGASWAQAPARGPPAPGLGQTLLVGPGPASRSCLQRLPGHSPSRKAAPRSAGQRLRWAGAPKPGTAELGREASRLWRAAAPRRVGLRTQITIFLPVVGSLLWREPGPGARWGGGTEGAPCSRAARPRSLCVFGTGFPTSLPRLPFPLSFPLTQVPVEYPAIST